LDRGRGLLGRIIFVHWEQGFGDTIQLSRYAELLEKRGAKVVMSVQKPLFRLLSQLSPQVVIVDQDQVPEEFDFHCPLMSLPLAFRTNLETIPAKRKYLASDKSLTEKWQSKIRDQSRTRVGVAWRGNAMHVNDHNRSLDLSELSPLFSVPARFISLQTGLTDRERGLLQQFKTVDHFGDEFEDFCDTAAVIDLLDLVVTVDTSVAHLAGAMGKPVWILLPFNADWRWLIAREDSPWYPSARLFRQDGSYRWAGVVSHLCAELFELIDRSSTRCIDEAINSAVSKSRGG
jgi:Glycosyltransferase family 9 (heptosyltransferase)